MSYRCYTHYLTTDLPFDFRVFQVGGTERGSNYTPCLFNMDLVNSKMWSNDELCSEIGIVIAKRFKAHQTSQRAFCYLRWHWGAAAFTWDFGGLELRLLWLGRLGLWHLLCERGWRVLMYTEVRIWLIWQWNQLKMTMLNVKYDFNGRYIFKWLFCPLSCFCFRWCFLKKF